VGKDDGIVGCLVFGRPECGILVLYDGSKDRDAWILGLVPERCRVEGPTSNREGKDTSRTASRGRGDEKCHISTAGRI